MKEAAYQNLQKAAYAKKQLKENGVEVLEGAPSYNEFIIKLGKPIEEINQGLLDKGFIGGYDLGFYYPEYQDHMLLCVTEVRTKEEIDQFAKELGALV